MAAVKSNDTKPEITVRRYLHSRGFRFRLHDRKLPGTPDIVMPKYRTVILVNGCFWHGHDGCRQFRLPKSNSSYWVSKIERNKKRDIENISKLNKLGWRVIIVWECELKTAELRNTTLSALESEIRFHDNEYVIKNENVPIAAEPEIGYRH